MLLFVERQPGKSHVTQGKLTLFSSFQFLSLENGDNNPVRIRIKGDLGHLHEFANVELEDYQVLNVYKNMNPKLPPCPSEQIMVWWLSSKISIHASGVCHTHFWKFLPKLEVLFWFAFGMSLHSKVYVLETAMTKKDSLFLTAVSLHSSRWGVHLHEILSHLFLALIIQVAIWAVSITAMSVLLLGIRSFWH